LAREQHVPGLVLLTADQGMLGQSRPSDPDLPRAEGRLSKAPIRPSVRFADTTLIDQPDLQPRQPVPGLNQAHRVVDQTLLAAELQRLKGMRI
jgi:hypothetical protein